MNWKNQLVKTPFLIVCMASAAAFAEESTIVTSDDGSAVQDDANFTTMDGRFIRYENVENLSSYDEAGLLMSMCVYDSTTCRNEACPTGGAKGTHVYRCFDANGNFTGTQTASTCCGG